MQLKKLTRKRKYLLLDPKKNIKMINKISILLLINIIMIGCKNYKIINGDKCEILTNTSLHPIKILLETANVDTFYNLQKISIDYSRHGYYLIDKENKWKLNFSGNYPNVHIKYVDSNFVILYCPVSGIMNGLTFFPSDHDDLFLIEREPGKKILDIQSKKGGITKALINEGVIYFEYYEPDIVRYISMKDI